MPPSPGGEKNGGDEPESELEALRKEYDAYIESSRMLEEAMEEDMENLQKKLEVSEQRNVTLKDALEEIRPQVTKLEAALGEAKRQLQEEKQTRVEAEMKQNQAETKLRLAESSLLHVQEEKDGLLEELAFVGADVEEMTQALENEKLRHKEELERLESDYRRQIQSIPRSSLKSSPAPIQSQIGSNGKSNHDKIVPLDLEDDLLVEDDDDGVVQNNDDNNSQESNLLGDIQEVDEEHEHDNDAPPPSNSTPSNDKITNSKTSAEQGSLVRAAGTPPRIPSSLRVDTERSPKSDGGNVGDDEQQEYINALEKELETVTEDLIATQQKLSEAELRVSEAQERQLQWEEEKEELQKLSNEAIEEAGIQSDLAKTAEENLAQKQNELEELQEQFTLAKQELGSTKEEIELIPELEAALTEVQTQLEQKIEELTNKEREFTKEKEQLDADLEELAKFQEQKEASEAEQKAELLQKLEQTTKEKEDVEERLSTLQSNLDRAEARVEELTDQLEEKTSALDVARNAIQDTQNEGNNVDVSKERQQSLIVELQAEVKSLRDKLRTEEQKSLEGMNNASSRGEEQISQLKSQILVLENELKESRKQDVTSQLSKLQSDYEVLKQEIAQKEEERQSLENQLEEAKEQLQEAKTMAEFKAEAGDRTSTPQYVDTSDELLATPPSPTPKGGFAFTPASRQALRSPTHDMFHLTHDDDSAASSVGEEGKDDNDENAVNGEQNGAAVAVETTKTLTLAQKTQWMRQHNAQLLHQLLALQGNIQVCCRVRPALRGEVAFQGNSSNAPVAPTVVVEPLSETEIGVITNPQELILSSSASDGSGIGNGSDEIEKGVKIPSSSGIATQWKSFQFDKVWGPDTSQFDVFLDVEPLALSVVDGYNACIFAYGQTGSGKTFTMEGSANNWGISQRTISKIFHLLKQRQSQNKENSSSAPDFEIQVGMLEIYNENIYDLLNATGKIDTTATSSLEIRRDSEGRTTVPDLTREPVKSLKDVMTLLQRGNANRATASTHMNEHSSRSHMVLQVQVTTNGGGSGDEANAAATRGSLYLVDLAGSERVRKSNVSGKELREAQYINKSLSALGDVMEALDKKSSHIPYRNSKLTHLLQDSLSVGGGSKTLMVVTVCPTLQSSKETQYALQFAARARNVHLGKATRNNVVSTKNLEERIKVMDREMKILQRAKDRSDEQLNLLKRENNKLQEKLSTSSTLQARTKTHEENRALVALRKTTNEITLKYEKEKSLNEKHVGQNDALQRELKQCQMQITQLSKDRDLIHKTLEQRDQELSEMRRELRKSRDSLAAEKLRARRAQLLQSSPTPTTNATASGGGTPASSSLPVPTVTIPSTPPTPSNNTTSNNSVSSRFSTSGIVPRDRGSPTGSGRISSSSGLMKQTASSKSRTSLLRPPTASSSGLSSRNVGSSSSSSRAGTAPAATNRSRSSRHSTLSSLQTSTSTSSSSSLGGRRGSNSSLPNLMAGGSANDNTTDSTVVASIRDKCYQILSKHDPPKASRLDQIMERFKGREHVLLDKIRNRYAESHVAPIMKGGGGGGGTDSGGGNGGGDDGESNSDRWESDSVLSSASSVMTSPKMRSELSIRKHKARMRVGRGPGGTAASATTSTGGGTNTTSSSTSGSIR